MRDQPDVYICNNKSSLSTNKKMKNYKEILIEKFIPGREIQLQLWAIKN